MPDLLSMGELDLAGVDSRGLSLPEACARAEESLTQEVHGIVQATVQEASDAECRISETRFTDGEVAYESRIRESASDGSVLRVAVGEVGAHWDADVLDRREVSVAGSGSYTSVIVQLDPRLASVADPIAEAIRDHLHDGYRRLEAQVLGRLLTVEYQVATRLYVELRSVLDEPVASRVGLYGLTSDGRAMYALDPPVIQTALTRLKVSRPSAAASPIVLTAMLVKGWLTEEETVARQALSVAQPVEVRLEDLRYTTTPGLDLAERGLYGPTATCQPLVRDGPIRLMAGYPSDLRWQVEPALDGLRSRFAEILGDHASSMSKMLEFERTASDRHWTVDRFAELLGRFAGGFTDTFR